MMVNPQQKNFTRRSPSIPRKLLRSGAVHLLPLYYLLRLSDLAREGIERSGIIREHRRGLRFISAQEEERAKRRKAERRRRRNQS